VSASPAKLTSSQAAIRGAEIRSGLRRIAAGLVTGTLSFKARNEKQALMIRITKLILVLDQFSRYSPEWGRRGRAVYFTNQGVGLLVAEERQRRADFQAHLAQAQEGPDQP